MCKDSGLYSSGTHPNTKRSQTGLLESGRIALIEVPGKEGQKLVKACEHAEWRLEYYDRC
jgi:hypothetical protein